MLDRQGRSAISSAAEAARENEEQPAPVAPPRPPGRSVLSFQTLQLAPIFGSEGHPLRESITAVSAAGFTHIGLDSHSIDAHVAAGGSVADIAEMLDANGLVCSDIAPLVLTDDGESNLAKASRFAGLATAIGADVALAAFDPSVGDWREPRVLDSVKGAVETLHEHGVRTALEFIPYTTLATIEAALELREAVGADRAGLCVDAFHTLAGDDLPSLYRLRASDIVMVQVDDAQRSLLADLLKASRHHRVLPGEGDLPLKAFVEALQMIGYHGLVSIEVLSDAVRSGPAAAFALASRRALDRAWGPSIG